MIAWVGMQLLPQLGQRKRRRAAKPEEFFGIENGAGAPFALPKVLLPRPSAKTPTARACAPTSAPQRLAWPSPAAELVLVREPNANRELKNREPRAFCPAPGGWRACPAQPSSRLSTLLLAHTGDYTRLWVEYCLAMPARFLPPDTAHSGCLAFPFPSLLHCLHRA